MSTSFWISLATAVTTGVFAVFVLARYQVRRRWHLLAWGVGLVLYSLSSLAQALLVSDFNGFLFKFWYWAGAVAVAPWLGQGTMFLLARRKKWTWISFWAIIVLCVLSLPLIFGADLNASAYQLDVALSEQFQNIFITTGIARTIRVVLVIVLNTYGTLLLVGGAVYSAFIFWRKRVLMNRMWGSVLIAIGGLLPAMGGFLILLGSPDFKYWGQLFGGLILFAGFLVATKGEPVPQKKAKTA
ncbi:MAG: hypothetical protein CSA11_00250 [Chloroflexi bacterium]|nr:MAG: hypothetical protein CSB13_11450 [Chloroflexota bacterium]PIE82528.1 MAG: hypothetical protein CSA11_00250 [Chloroflexota bacterium]